MGYHTFLVAGVLASWALAVPVDVGRKSTAWNSTLPANLTVPARPVDYSTSRSVGHSPSDEDADESYSREQSSQSFYTDTALHDPDREYRGSDRGSDRGRSGRGRGYSDSYSDQESDDYLPPTRNPAYLQALANAGYGQGSGYPNSFQNRPSLAQIMASGMAPDMIMPSQIMAPDMAPDMAMPSEVMAPDMAPDMAMPAEITAQDMAPDMVMPEEPATRPAPPPGVWTQTIAETSKHPAAPAAIEQQANPETQALKQVPAQPAVQSNSHPASWSGLQHAVPQADSQRPAPAAAFAPAAVADETATKKSLWQPPVGAKYQIILSAPIDTGSKSSFSSKKADILPSDAQIFDIDLFDTDADDIKALHAAGKKVICYFSAGTWEKARPDTADYPASIKGSGVKRNDFGAYWDELWLDIRHPNPTSAELPLVWKLMQSRIKLAAEKGCDAIDPDNMDAFDPDNSPIGFPITKSDSVTYLRFMADEAAKHGMSIGLKNAMDMLPDVSDVIQFAVNEQCVGSDECGRYHQFLGGASGRGGKPVFHIEYIDDDSKGPATMAGSRAGSSRNTAMAGRLMDSLCMKNDGSRVNVKFSTVIKEMELGGWVQFCDGSQVTTSTKDKSATSSRGNRSGKDSSDSSDNEDASEDSMSGMGSAAEAAQSSAMNSAYQAAQSSTASTAGGMLSSLGSGLYGLLTGGYKSAPSATTSSSSSSGWSNIFGGASSSKPSSYSSTSSSSSSSSGSWLSSIFSGSGSSSASKPSAPAAPAKPAASSSGGFWNGISNFFGYGSESGSSSSSRPAPPAPPAPAPAPAASCSSSSSSGLGGFLSGLNPFNWFKKGC